MAALDDFHLITVDEYLRLAEDPRWEKTELIRGMVYDVAPQYDLHAGAAFVVAKAVDEAFPDDVVRFAGSIQAGSSSVVEPDVYVIDGAAVYAADAPIPGAFLKLAVEVSVTTQARDLGPKLRAYAEAGIPEYWMIDPRPGSGYLLRHTEPEGLTYRRVRRYDVGEGARDLDVPGLLDDTLGTTPP